MINIILIAPPAAGKGTQAALISGHYHIPHISTGDLLRASVQNKDEFSKDLEKQLASGHLVSDEIVFSLLKKRISNLDCKNGFILDGFPRNLKQAEHYDEILNDLYINKVIVILIDVDFEIAQSRITGRLLCPKCGSTYNDSIEEMKPQMENTCDRCQSKLIKRSDDNLETYNIRYQNYMEKTEPLIEYYDNKKMLYRVDGNKSSEHIYEEIDQILKKYL